MCGVCVCGVCVHHHTCSGLREGSWTSVKRTLGES